MNNASVSTVGHGLSQAPELIIWKSLTSNTNYWQVLAQAANGGNGHLGRLALQRTDAFVAVSSVWNNTQPTSTVFTLGTSCVGSGVAYCWHSVAGYSAIGTYTGSNPTKVTVNLGFEPSWIMIKSTSNSYGWYMLDNKRSPTGNWDDYLYANSNGVEGTSGGNWIKAISTGFETNPSGGSVTNQNGVDYLYMAFK